MNLSPIGLLFATAVAFFTAVHAVFNKRAVEGQNIAAVVFWIRLSSALVFSVVMLAFTLKGSASFIHVPASLAPGDLQNIPALADQLRNPANPAVEKIASSLSESTRKQLANYRSGVADAELTKSLQEDFNGRHIIGGGLLYNPRDFAHVTLSAETVRVLGKGPRDQARSYANRLLLEDLFPGTIASSTKCALFGMKRVMVSPGVAFSTYLFIEIILVVWSQFLNSAALKVSPISLCVPFQAFMPIFMLGTGYVVLGELPTVMGLMGIGLIVIGGVLMNRNLFAVGWQAPFQAIVKEKGSRYMLLSVFIGAVFSPIEKELILMSDSMSAVFIYGIGTVIGFWLLCKMRRVDIMKVIRERPYSSVLCGLCDGLMMIAQFIAVMYLQVVITMCIKRAGVVLTVVAGWLFFREREITDRMIGSLAMVGGIAIFYLPLRMTQALTLTGIVVAGLVVALYLTRHTARNSALAKESAEVPVHS